MTDGEHCPTFKDEEAMSERMTRYDLVGHPEDCAMLATDDGEFVTYEDCNTKITELAKQARGLAEAFMGYSGHDVTCTQIVNGIDGDCSCGFIGQIERAQAVLDATEALA